MSLNHEQIKSHPERISNIKPFIEQYNWKEIDFPSHINNWKTFESNNKSIAFNILYVPHNTEEIRHAYISKYNLDRENQVILLSITDGKKWHYLAVKKLFALLRGTSKNNGDFYYVSCFHSFRTKNKLKKHQKVCENHDYCDAEMSEEGNKILKYNHGEKSMKVQFIIYANLESLLEKMNTCHNDPGKSSTTKINKHTASGYSLFTQCSFGATKNKLDYYRGKNCMKNFCLDLSGYAIITTNYEKKEMIPLTNKEEKMCNRQKLCYICKKRFSTDDNNKVRDHYHYTGRYRTVAHRTCNLRYKTSKEIPVIFHNGSAYDYHL